MPLIFLDTPQINLLEEIRRSDPHRYASFQSDWHERGCSLVFTSTQASEVRRYPDSMRRQGRYLVLADLAPIRSDLPLPPDETIKPRTLTEHEIVRAMYDRNLANAFSPAIEPQLAHWRDVFPGYIDGQNVSLLQTIEDESLLDVFNCMYDASRHAAKAEECHAQNKKMPRMRDLSNAPPSAENVLEWKTTLKKRFASLRDQYQLGNWPLDSAEAVSAIEGLALGFIDRMQEIGSRPALLETLPVAGLDTNGMQKQPLREYVNSWFFQFQVRKLTGELLSLDEQEQEFLARTLCLADCPGSWLYHKLRLCIGRGSLQPRPNHLYDAERLAYLPYVDLLLTDAEMGEYMRQIRNDQSTPARIKEARPPLSIPNSIKALQEAIHSLNP